MPGKAAAGKADSKSSAGGKSKEHPHAKWLTTFGRRGMKAGTFSDPSHVAVGGEELYVVDTENARLQVFAIASNGGLKFTKSFGSGAAVAAAAAAATNPNLNAPSACALSATECFVSDTGNNRICVYRRADGAFVRAFPLNAGPAAPAAAAAAGASSSAAAAAAAVMDTKQDTKLAATAATSIPVKASASASAAPANSGDAKSKSKDAQLAAVAKADRAAEQTKKQLLAAIAAMDMNDDDGGDDDDDDADGGMAAADFGETPDGPGGIAVSGNELYVADDSVRSIRVFDLSGKLLRVIGSAEASASTAAAGATATATATAAAGIHFGDTISALAIDGDELYAVDSSEHRIVVLNRVSGAFVRAFGSKGTRDGELDEPTGCSVAGSRVFVSDGQNSRISVFDKSSGKFLWKFNSGESGVTSAFELPSSVAVAGNLLFVSDALKNSISVSALAVPVK